MDKLNEEANLLFHLQVASRFENIELVQTVLSDSLERAGVDADSSHWVDLAVREAVANAIKHGNQQDPTKQVEIDLHRHDERLVIRILDEGEGFDPSSLADPLEPTNLLRPNGRGIFYMNSFMDRIDFSFRQGGGTIVTLEKRVEGLEEPAGT